ncbi:MAG TPA: acetylornithine deacetylase [Thermoanaerobaculia bacterium]|nr:acetylornithine deacetylase [Thermoanaerobaculia bacterium]
MAVLSDPDLLARLVAFDTTSRNSNLPLADFLCDYLDRPGVRIARQPSPDGTKANLIAWLGPEPEPVSAGNAADRPGLVLSGHMDVVPAEEADWRSDPFTLTDGGDRWLARGACDMKGFLAVAANAMTALTSTPLRAPLALVFTYDEEVGTLGARHLLESYPEGRLLPRSAIIGEPTSLRVVRAHKGHLKLRVTLSGRSAHSGYPHLGLNAIEPAGRVIGALAALRRTLESEHALHAELFPEVPFVPLNVARVQGGAAINVVPDRCTVELGVRALPGVDSRQLAGRIEQVARAAAAPFVPDFEVLADSPPLLVAEDAPVLRRLCSLVGQRDTATVSFATDAGWLQRLGMDCVLFGPGSIDAAHRPNEFVPKADLATARDVLERAIAACCLTADGADGAGNADGAGEAEGTGGEGEADVAAGAPQG